MAYTRPLQRLVDTVKKRKGFNPSSPAGHGAAKIQKSINEKNLDSMSTIRKELKRIKPSRPIKSGVPNWDDLY